MVVGAPGGSRIINGVLQVILNVVDFRMNVQDAVDWPRFHHQWMPDKLYLEQGVSPDTVALLKGMGHDVESSENDGGGDRARGGDSSTTRLAAGRLRRARSGQSGGLLMNHVLSTHLFVNHRLTTVWLDKIWHAGIPAVEIFCARQHLDYRDQAQIAELGHWFRDSQLKLHSLHSPMYTRRRVGPLGSAVGDRHHRAGEVEAHRHGG